MMEENLFPIIKMLTVKIENRANENLKEFDLTGSQIRVLVMLNDAKQGFYSMKELERIFDVSQATMGGIISRLEKKGFVEGFADTKDRRIKCVRLTESGKVVSKTAQKKMMETAEWLTRELSEEESCELVRLLNLVYKSIKA